MLVLIIIIIIIILTIPYLIVISVNMLIYEAKNII